MLNLLVGLFFSFSALAQPAFLNQGLVAYYPFNRNANDESRHQELMVVNVSARSDIFLAGADSAASLNGDNIANATPFVVNLSSLLVATNQGISFSAKGLWDLDPNGAGNPVDGGGNITTSGTIYGIGSVTAKIMGLVAVFIDDKPYRSRGTPPQGLGYTRSLDVIAPKLYQPVYIGSGTNEMGRKMQFAIPQGATGLCLGALDAGTWNNIGFASVTIYDEGYSVLNPRIASASAEVVNGFIVGIKVNKGGYGYDSDPSVTIDGGGGFGATAVATQIKGQVTSIKITNPGSGYTSAPTITIAPPPFPPRKATGTAQIVNGFVVGTKITDSGFGYDSPPVVLIVGGGGSGAVAVATVANGVVTAITITNPGAGYTSTPLIRIASPPFAPKLGIETSKVFVRMSVVLGRKYQLEASTDLNTWTSTGPAFIAQAEELAQEFDVNQVGRYFRINQVP